MSRVSGHACLAFYIAYLSTHISSKWKGYLDSLPQDVTFMPVLFSAQLISCLPIDIQRISNLKCANASSVVDDVGKMKETIKKDYTSTVELLQYGDQISYEQFTWAWLIGIFLFWIVYSTVTVLVNTRCVYLDLDDFDDAWSNSAFQTSVWYFQIG